MERPLRRRGSRADPPAAPAPLLRRVDREPRAARLHAPRARLPRLRRRDRARARRTAGGRARARAQEDRQRRDDARRRPRDPSDQRARRRLLPGADAPRAARARRAARAGARGGARDRALDGRLRLPRARRRVRARRARPAGRVRDRARPDRLDRRARHRARRSTTSTSRSCTSSARTRCSRSCAAAARTSAARSRATRLGSEQLSPLAREAAAEVGLGDECRDPFRSIVVRSVELVYACDEALRLIEAYEEPDRPAERSSRVAGTGYGVSEAPRGLLYHRYRLDGDGTILDAKIVPPTSQNQLAIEDDLRDVVGAELQPRRRRAARPVRADDPQLRPVHLVRDALPRPPGGAAMTRTVVIGIGNRSARRRRGRSRGRRAAAPAGAGVRRGRLLRARSRAG